MTPTRLLRASLLVACFTLQGREADAFGVPRSRSAVRMQAEGVDRRHMLTKWAAVASLGVGLSLAPAASAAPKLVKFEELYPKLEKLRDDVIDDAKTGAILKVMKDEFTKDNLFQIARASQEITFADKDFDDKIVNIDRDVNLIVDVLVEPRSAEKKALRIVAFRQLSRRLEAEIHSLEKLVTGRTSEMESTPPAV